MLLERVDELTLRLHDFRGNPAAMLAGVLARIDRLKEARSRAAEYAAWAARAARRRRARRARARVRRRSTPTHDRMLARAGRARPRRPRAARARRCCASARTCARASPARCRHVLVDDVQDLALRRSRGSCCAAGRRARRADGRRRRRPGDPRAARRGGEEPARPRRRAAATRARVRLERSLRCPRARSLDAAAGGRRAEPGPASPSASTAAPAAATRPRSGAARTSARRRRPSRPRSSGWCARARRPARSRVLVRSRAQRGPGDRRRARRARRALPPRRRRGVLRSAPRSRTSSPGCGCSSTPATPAPSCARWRGRRSSCARSTSRAASRSRGGASSTWSRALAAATESPQLPPEARERILGFLKLHRQAAAALDTTRPDLFVHRLIDRLGLRRQQLFAAQADVVERLRRARAARRARRAGRAPHAAGDARASSPAASPPSPRPGCGEERRRGRPAQPRTAPSRVMAMHAAKGREFDHVLVLGLQSSRMPGARRRAIEPIPDALLHEELPPDTREAHVARDAAAAAPRDDARARGLVLAYAARTERGALQPPSPFAEEARAAARRASGTTASEELFGPDEALHAAVQRAARRAAARRCRASARGSASCASTPTSTSPTASCATSSSSSSRRCCAAPEGQSVADALPGINAASLQAATAAQREILADRARSTSSCSTPSATPAPAPRRSPRAPSRRSSRSCRARGEGLLLSASDIETYRTCPLKYKFARVFRIPSEPTLNQRFGILVHQVLERYHRVRRPDASTSCSGCSRRAGGAAASATSDEERQLHAKADSALRRYHERFARRGRRAGLVREGLPVPHRAPHAARPRRPRRPPARRRLRAHRLQDRPAAVPPRSCARTSSSSLYAVGAREAWQRRRARARPTSTCSTTRRSRCRPTDIDRDWIAETVIEVADGILGQGFEPTPSYAACSMCDYRIACPAAER